MILATPPSPIEPPPEPDLPGLAAFVFGVLLVAFVMAIAWCR